jgi:hypothetical protein
MTLPYDVTRCQGIDADNLPCDIRHKCERYLALMDAAPDSRSPVVRFLCEHGTISIWKTKESYPLFIPAKR